MISYACVVLGNNEGWYVSLDGEFLYKDGKLYCVCPKYSLGRYKSYREAVSMLKKCYRVCCRVKEVESYSLFAVEKKCL